MTNYRRKAKLVFEAQPHRRRRQARPIKEWEQDIGEITRGKGTELKTQKKMAQDREQHRNG